eukprot:COSAG02_NODE_407_length_22898_cov_135.264047_21_plen_113_part_00
MVWPIRTGGGWVQARGSRDGLLVVTNPLHTGGLGVGLGLPRAFVGATPLLQGAGAGRPGMRRALACCLGLVGSVGASSNAYCSGYLNSLPTRGAVQTLGSARPGKKKTAQEP